MSIIGYRDDPVFKSFFGDSGPLTQMRTPDWPAMKSGLAMDMRETPESFIAKIDAPGLKKEEINISCENDILTISAEMKKEQKHKDDKVHWEERTTGHVSRSIRLPEHVDQSAITATQENGVLTVNIPKKTKTQPKSLKINVQ